MERRMGQCKESMKKITVHASLVDIWIYIMDLLRQRRIYPAPSRSRGISPAQREGVGRDTLHYKKKKEKRWINNHLIDRIDPNN